MNELNKWTEMNKLKWMNSNEMELNEMKWMNV